MRHSAKTDLAMLLTVILCAYLLQQPPGALLAQLFADISISTEAMVVLSGMGIALCGAIGFIFRLLVAQLQADRDSWKQIGIEAVGRLKEKANKDRRESGRPLVEEVADVLSEHSSPPKEQQKQTAALQTTRAALVAMVKDLGLEPTAVDVVTMAGDVADKAAEVVTELRNELQANELQASELRAAEQNSLTQPPKEK